MRTLIFALCLILASGGLAPDATAATRFSRKVLEVKNKQAYKFFRLDDLDLPYLDGDSATVSCMVYRGAQRYYVEVGVTNNGTSPIEITGEAIRFEKPGYTSFRTNAMAAAMEAAAAANVPFVPVPPPDMGTTTTIDATTQGSGSYSHTSGTATTTPSSAQVGANIGNSLGNLMASRQVAKAQSEAARFANFLSAFSVDEQRGLVEPGQTRLVIATFEQIKDKRAPFSVTVVTGGREYVFEFQEW